MRAAGTRVAVEALCCERLGRWLPGPRISAGARGNALGFTSSVCSRPPLSVFFISLPFRHSSHLSPSPPLSLPPEPLSTLNPDPYTQGPLASSTTQEIPAPAHFETCRDRRGCSPFFWRLIVSKEFWFRNVIWKRSRLSNHEGREIRFRAVLELLPGLNGQMMRARGVGP